MTFDEWWDENIVWPEPLGKEDMRKCFAVAQAAQCEADAMWLRNMAAEWRKLDRQKSPCAETVAAVLDDYAAAIRAAKER